MSTLADNLDGTDHTHRGPDRPLGDLPMIRRARAGLFAAALLVLAPSAAFAAPEYSDDDFDLAVSTTNPAPGETFTVTITAPSGVDVTLTVSSDDENVSDDDIQIAGTKSLTKTSVDGQAVFSVTLSEEGTYSLVAKIGR